MRKALSALTGWWCRSSLVVRILIGLFAGAVLGLTVPDARGISILGTVFVGALKAIAPVLVAVLVASALSRAHSHMGARFRTVILLYLLTTALAAVVAVAASPVWPAGRCSLSLWRARSSASPTTSPCRPWRWDSSSVWCRTPWRPCSIRAATPCSLPLPNGMTKRGEKKQIDSAEIHFVMVCVMPAGCQ